MRAASCEIFPLYYGFLAIALLVFPFVVPSADMPSRIERWLCVSYLLNWTWFYPWHHHVLTHFWSLCIEEQFYLVWPLIVLAVSPRRLLSLVLALEVMVLGGRCWWVYHHGPGVAVQFATITRMDGLLLGAACALIVRQFRIPRWSASALFWLAVLLVASYVAGFRLWGFAHQQAFKQSVGYAILATGFAALVCMPRSPMARPSGSKRDYAGGRSCSSASTPTAFMSCTSPPSTFWIGWPTACRPGSPKSLCFTYCFMAFKFAVAFGVASLSYNLYEKRFLALKDRFAPIYREAPVAGSVAPA